MIEPLILNWSVVIFILLTGWLAAYWEHMNDEE
jgi:hypothetical protein